MDWLERMNRAIDYIEANLTSGIDFEKVARTAFCSMSHFQRLFSFITDVPLSEYVRNRKMTQAGIELKSSGAKVIDIALKHGLSRLAETVRNPRGRHGTN